MRVVNRHKGFVAGIEPGGTGELDPENSGIRVFLEAGLLVAADTIKEPAREPAPTEPEAPAKKGKG